ncbi:hypothetical protein BpHYR1_031835 [Brachionus plicatilis]|uniref:Uncharacterized protein n=1 Tax=Brachionus plicatilis TaxID=10195 RepID=A0A3M7SYK0_BRAPC|nr:hypothetical protein BpHYR1_031835 [Brachionus plicatilis]
MNREAWIYYYSFCNLNSFEKAKTKKSKLKNNYTKDIKKQNYSLMIRTDIRNSIIEHFEKNISFFDKLKLEIKESLKNLQHSAICYATF